MRNYEPEDFVNAILDEIRLIVRGSRWPVKGGIGIAMTAQTTTDGSPGYRLRQAWAAGTVVLPGVFNGLVARIAEQIGFQAVYLSGGALSAAAALPDIGLLTLTEFVEQARAITQATSLPLLCDADTG